MRVRTHTNPFIFTERLPKVDFKSEFPGFNGALDLEVGFGRGVFLRHYTTQFPDRLLVGVEIRKQIVQILRERLDDLGIQNAYLVHSTAQICLEDMIDDGALERVFVFHPDPWFKKRHHKRRVINPKFLALLKQKMAVGGRLYVSTDVEILWDAMLETIDADGGFSQIQDDPFWTEVYRTHWSEFSEEDSRSEYFSTFEKTG